ncbi:TetR/AcrR family transcriptional regulator [Deferribacter thermophilus]|uniref:TetR/AcrR family transcriptional regulator n=1 Tax=Deferribacter thermophilus TaxID=53573 RepID=UPI003C1FA17F
MSQSEGNTLDKIIEAAIKIFAQKGFWKTKVSDIVREAGVAQGTFYLYFKSKEDCFYDLLSYLHENMIKKLLECCNEEDKRKCLSTYCKVFIEYIYEYKMLSKVFLFEALSSGERFKDLYFSFRSRLKNIIADSMGLHFDDPKVILLTGFLKELIVYYIIYKDYSLDKIYRLLDEGLKIILGEEI